MLNPEDIRDFRESAGLSTQELGEILGMRDAGRIVRGWETGVRNGHPFVPSGSAGRALYLLMVAADQASFMGMGSTSMRDAVAELRSEMQEIF